MSAFWFVLVYQRRAGLCFDDTTQTGLVLGLSTVHLSFALHVPWYYLVDGAGWSKNGVVVWSWPSSVILTVRVFWHYIHALAHSGWCRC
jgi:hypothetical protein